MTRITHTIEEHVNRHVRPHSPEAEAKPQNPLVAIVVNEEEKVFSTFYFTLTSQRSQQLLMALFLLNLL